VSPPKLARAGLYLDAARSLRPEQIAWRARRALPPRLLAAGTAARRVPAWSPVAVGIGVDRAPQGGPAPSPEIDGTFAAMGSSRSFDSESFWTDAVDGELFLFHLHGFSGLATYAAGARSAGGDAFWAQVVESWIASESRPRMPSWHPYPTSVRVISWAAGLSAIEGWPEGTRSRIAAELWRQARYLSRCVERDIGGNHLIKNALALAAAGSLFGDAGLRDRGIGLLRLELDRQLLADGGHEERSTSYHRLVRHDLEDAAALLARAQGAAPAWLERALERAGAWEAAMRGPDGTLALLNDSWEGPSEGAPATEPVTPLAASGYTVLRH